VKDSLLLEQRGLGGGSSSWSAGFIESQYLAEEHLSEDRIRLCAWSLECFERLEWAYGLTFHHVGKLLLGSSRAHVEEFMRSIQVQRDLGIVDSAVLGPDEVRLRAPQLQLDNVAGALWGPRDGYIDPSQLCRVYTAVASSQGAVVQTSTCVQQVLGLDSGGFTVVTDRGTFTCERVVNAAGAWAARVDEGLGVILPIHGYRQQLALYDVVPGFDSRLPLVVDPGHVVQRGVLYFREDGPSRVVAGLHSEDTAGLPADDSGSWKETVDVDFQLIVAEQLRKRVRPEYALSAAGGWAGLYPLTPDGKLILGESRAVPGLIHAAGLGGNGIQISPAVGRITADVIVDGGTDLLRSLEPYRLERFGGDSGRFTPGTEARGAA